MHVLAINCGSSSVKSALIDTRARARVFAVRIENFGGPDCTLQLDASPARPEQVADVDEAVARIVEELQARDAQTHSPQAIVHRVVHGGERFVQPALIDASMLRELAALNRLAPLHNPVALQAIARARSAFSDLPHFAVFDTAFHASLPAHAREYAIDAQIRERSGARRFGFHGISHAHVLDAVAAHTAVQPHSLRIVSCHLGNGASVAAIEGGHSVDTSMGMTPLEGLVMGSRAGDLDPGLLLHLQRDLGMSVQQLDQWLTSHCGLRGMTGTNDLRQVERRARDGDEQCGAALALYAYRIRKYIGAYAAAMGGIDVVAFTGGVGENSALIRARALERLQFLGVHVDPDANQRGLQSASSCVDIGARAGRTRVLIVRADEELAMAIEVERLSTAH